MSALARCPLLELAPISNISESSPSCYEGPSFLFRVMCEGPNSAAQRADSGDGVLGERADGLSLRATGSGERCKPAAKRFCLHSRGARCSVGATV